MPENNQILSVAGQLVGMPTAGPESFSQQQLDYLKRALGVDETVLWERAEGSSGANSGTLSEAYTNFDVIEIYMYTNDRAQLYTRLLPAVGDNVDVCSIHPTAGTAAVWIKAENIQFSGTSFTVSNIRETSNTNIASAWANVSVATFKLYVTKIVGIRRIANN